MSAKQRIILSGGPGTGKTTLLTALQKRGYACMPEISREIIAEQLARGSDVLPWDNLLAFSRIVFAGRMQQYQNAMDGITFYDRSVFDTIAYMHHDKLEIPEDWNELLKDLNFYNKVFITPPWRTIFNKDSERREEWEKLLTLHEHLVKTYEKAGFDVVLLPKTSIEKRISIVLSYLK